MTSQYLSFYFYADGSRLYTTFTYSDNSDQDRTVQCIEVCLADIKKWMSPYKLKLYNGENLNL